MLYLLWGDIMASTDAQKRAVKKAQSKCDAIMLRPPKEEGTAIRAAAAAARQSNQQYILQAVQERMRQDVRSPQEAVRDPTAPSAGGGGILSPDTIKAAQEAAQITGEALPQFVTRAVETQVQRDKTSLLMGIHPATGERFKK